MAGLPLDTSTLRIRVSQIHCPVHSEYIPDNTIDNAQNDNTTTLWYFCYHQKIHRSAEQGKGSGISAGLFYEGKVAEAISLIVEWSRLQQQRKEVRKKLSVQDVQQLENLTLYLNDHCIQDIPLEQIVRISCMSARKLQTAFKEYHGCAAYRCAW